MRYVRLSMSPLEAVHPAPARIVGADYVRRVQLRHWSLSNPERPALLLFVEGDRDRFEADAAASPIADIDIAPVDGERFYALVRPELTDAARTLVGALTRDGVVVAPPVVYEGDTATMELVGSPAALQGMVESVPDELSVEVREVGSRPVPTDPDETLSDRQREALSAALDLGYYDTPRRSTHEAVAERLGCAPSTASEHLKRGEAKLVRAALGG